MYHFLIDKEVVLGSSLSVSLEAEVEKTFIQVLYTNINFAVVLSRNIEVFTHTETKTREGRRQVKLGYTLPFNDSHSEF